MLLEGESINLHGTPLNRLSPANQSRSRHGPSHLSVQGTRRRLLSAWAGATSSVPGNSSCRRRKGGGRTERRKIMYNTNKVSPPAFIPNQFLVEEPNPEGRWEGGDAPGRNLVTRCTPVNRDKSCYLHSSPLQSPRSLPSCWQLHQQDQVPVLRELRRMLVGTAELGTQQSTGSSTSWHCVKGPAFCMQTASIFFARQSHNHSGEEG